MDKIIGFLISQEEKEVEIDFFHVGLKVTQVKYQSYNVYLWGIGDIEHYKINEKYSMSFPLHSSLFDRNVLISFENDQIIVENDWLGAIPIFYNPRKNIVSTLSNFCIKDKKIHSEGLSNFCEFGYSVFEQTMFEDVKFMRYFSKLVITDQAIKVYYKDDPVLENDFISEESRENDVIALMKEYVSKVEEQVQHEIILPTSGGYDSRILNYLIKDKERIRSFTYGVSKDQCKSFEVVHAKKISEIYNTKWEQIELTEFNAYLNKWFEVYGISTHAHGMYHIEFYTNIMKKHAFKSPSFLSGIIGDAWAEQGKFSDVESASDLINLGYTHGMNLDVKHLNFRCGNTIKEKVFQDNKEFLQNEKVKAVFAMRVKLILISYLTQIPEYFGMPVWTPFLNFNIVKAMLNIRDERRKNRLWQRDFFRKVGLNLEDMHLNSSRSNRLNDEIVKNTKFEILDEAILSPYVSQQRIAYINRILSKPGFLESVKNYLLYVPKVGGLMRRLGCENKVLKALYEYYVLKTMEKGLSDER